MFRKEMTFIPKPPTGVEPLIAPGFNPGIRDDNEVQANPKGVEHPQVKQLLSLVTAAWGGEESHIILRLSPDSGIRVTLKKLVFGRHKESL